MAGIEILRPLVLHVTHGDDIKYQSGVLVKIYGEMSQRVLATLHDDLDEAFRVADEIYEEARAKYCL